MTWTGKCSVGIYPGVRKFSNGHTVIGMFGLIGIEPPCHEPVTARCQFFDKGKLWPYYWLACSKPEHRKNAGVIQELDEHGNITQTIRILDTRVVINETVIAAEPEIIINGPTTIPRRQGKKILRNKRKLSTRAINTLLIVLQWCDTNLPKKYYDQAVRKLFSMPKEQLKEQLEVSIDMKQGESLKNALIRKVKNCGKATANEITTFLGIAYQPFAFHTRCHTKIKYNVKLPKYNPNSEFEQRITNQHQWRVVHDGGPEQCTQCGCWDPTPVGMPTYSMAPKVCDTENLQGRKLDEVMTLDEEIEHLFK